MKGMNMFSMKGVNNGISDLWFNHDKSEAENPYTRVKGEGLMFQGYDQEKLKGCAESFRNMLCTAGIEMSSIPSVEMLIEDFNDRV